MSPIEMQVLVFKTSIRRRNDLARVAAVLDREYAIRKWNVDQQDIDNILRIEAYELSPDRVIELMHDTGFQCEELPD